MSILDKMIARYRAALRREKAFVVAIAIIAASLAQLAL
jgi:hypothetical protein